MIDTSEPHVELPSTDRQDAARNLLATDNVEPTWKEARTDNEVPNAPAPAKDTALDPRTHPKAEKSLPNDAPHFTETDDPIFEAPPVLVVRFT